MKVSAVTIRQDLRALEDDGLLERTYGGAVRRESSSIPPELSFHVRMHKNRQNKEAIAAHAVRLIHEGDTIVLDASSTAYAMVAHVKQFQKMTVVTNSLVVAQSFLDSAHVQLLVPGGRLRRDSISIVGRPDAIPDVNINVGFFGARGISRHGGISDVDPDEVAVKQAMIARCVQKIIIADGSKWGQVAPYTFVRPEQVDCIITTPDAPISLVREFQERGVEVDIISMPGRE
jgi:DeoR family fructose operon transcriptional repressor